MKKVVFLLALVLFFANMFILSAQEGDKPKIFYKSAPIVKILSHTEGYKVIYRKSDLSLDTIYVPFDWIKAGGKCEIVYGDDPSYPYLAVYYKEGAFDFIRLYVQRNISHETWGVLKSSEATKERFNVEELQIDF